MTTPPHTDRGEQRTDARWRHPLLAALWLGLAALVPAWSGMSPWWLLAGLPLTLIARAAVDTWAPAHAYGPNHHHHAKNVVTAAGFTATAWLVYASHATTTPAAAIGLLAIWATLTGAAYAWLLTRAPAEATATAERRTLPAVPHLTHAPAPGTELATLPSTTPAPPPIDRKAHAQLWDGWLADVDLSGITVANTVATLAGYTLHLDAGFTSKGKAIKFSALTAKLEDLAILAARHYRKAGVDISRKQLRAEETASADRWLLHVSTEQPLRRTLIHPGDRGPVTTRDGFDLGIYEDGAPLRLKLLGVHMLMVAATGGGKTVFLNNIIAEGTRRPHVRVWVAARKKIMPLVFPWLYPWLTGQTDRPVLHRVAGEALSEILLMLRDLHEIVDKRNKRLGPNSSHRATPDDPAIILIIDEAASLCQDETEVVTTYDGREFTAGAILNALLEVARAADVSIMLFEQFGLYDALGKYGSMMMRNLTVRVCGKTMSASDGTNTLSSIRHVDTTQLRDNTLLIQPSSEEPRAMAAKSKLLDGLDQIAALAYAHTRYQSDTLPEWMTTVLGARHADRWRDFRQGTLVAACQLHGINYPVTVDGEVTAVHEHTAPSPAVAPAAAPDVDAADRVTHLPQPRDGHTLPDVHRSEYDQSRDDMAASHERLMRTLADYNAELDQYGPFGRVFSSVVKAFTARNAPAAGTPSSVARAADLYTGDTPAEKRDTEIAEMRAVLARYGVHPVTEDGREVYRRADVLAAYDKAHNDLVAERAAADPITAALHGKDDSEWIGVSAFGVAAGLIPDGDRTAAIGFGKRLRACGLPATAFRQMAAGSQVRVGDLRAADLTQQFTART